MTELMESVELCNECGVCLQVCPTYNATQDDNFSPIARIKVAGRILQGGEITPQMVESVYSCLECRLCTEACPFSIDIANIVWHSRLKLRKRGIESPEPHKKLVESTQRLGNAVNGDPARRLDWLPEEFPSRESSTLLYVGCASAYVTKDAAASSYLLLKKLGVDFMILKDEGCCGVIYGDAARDDLLREIAEENVNKFKKLGIKKIILVCPACYYCFKYLYPQLLGSVDFELVHIVQLLPSLLKERGIKIAQMVGEVTYHDPCRLARPDGIFDEPREVLCLSGIKVNELPENREDAPCCGAGAGVRMVCRDLSLKVASKVLDQVTVSPLVTACPFCEFSFSYIAHKRGSDKKVVYITEPVLQALS